MQGHGWRDSKGKSLVNQLTDRKRIAQIHCDGKIPVALSAPSSIRAEILLIMEHYIYIGRPKTEIEIPNHKILLAVSVEV